MEKENNMNKRKGIRKSKNEYVKKYKCLDPPIPSTLASRYLSSSASRFTASGDTFGAPGKQINTTLILSRLPCGKIKNKHRGYENQLQYQNTQV